jgi:hypothetical protein
MDETVVAATSPLLTSDWKANEAEHDRVVDALQRVEVGARHLTLELKAEALNEASLFALPSSTTIERVVSPAVV